MKKRTKEQGELVRRRRKRTLEGRQRKLARRNWSVICLPPSPFLVSPVVSDVPGNPQMHTSCVTADMQGAHRWVFLLRAYFAFVFRRICARTICALARKR